MRPWEKVTLTNYGDGTLRFLEYSQDHERYWKSRERYQAYLESVRDTLPDGVRKFIEEPWWYGPRTDPRSLHDSNVVSFVLREVGEDTPESPLEVVIEVSLLGPHRTARAKAEYTGVRHYELSLGREGDPWGRPARHGDWIVDEVSLTSTGEVVHEIWFAGGARWVIESRDFSFRSTSE